MKDAQDQSQHDLAKGLELLRDDGSPEAGDSDLTLLRQALEAEDRRLERNPEFSALVSDENRERRLNQLLQQLEAKAPKQTTVRRWWLPAFGLAMAALVVAAIFMPAMMAPPPAIYDEPPNWRGEITVVQRMAANPRADSESMVARLKAAGFSPRLYQSGQSFVVDLFFDEPLSTEQKAALGRETLDPTQKATRIEFAPRK